MWFESHWEVGVEGQGSRRGGPVVRQGSGCGGPVVRQGSRCGGAGKWVWRASVKAGK